MLEDRLTQRFYRLDWIQTQLLAAWHHGRRDGVRTEVARAVRPGLDAESIARMDAFLVSQGLALGGAASAAFAQARPLGRGPVGLVRRAFFMKLDMPFLSAIAARLPVAPIVRHAQVALVGMLMLVLFSLWTCWIHSVQIGNYASTFFGSLGAAFPGLVAFIVTKVVHEFGHALACRIVCGMTPRMGVALMCGMPIAYTDTTCTWQASHRARLFVDVAGLLVETLFAAVAALVFLASPDGMLAASAFAAAFVLWPASVATNAIPFMRYDGYYALSDAIGIANLMDAALAAMRSLFTGRTRQAEPIVRRGALLAFAAGWIIYRVLFVVGFVLLVVGFASPLVALIAGPVVAAATLLPVWNALFLGFEGGRDGRRLATTLTTAGLITAAVLWWSQSAIYAVAVAEPSVLRRVETVQQGIVVRMPSEFRISIREGENSVRLANPAMELEGAACAAEASAAELQRQDAEANQRDITQLAEIARKLAAIQARCAGIGERLGRLSDGAVAAGNFYPRAELGQGSWVRAGTSLGIVAGGDEALLEAYVPEHAAAGVRIGDAMRFVPLTASEPEIIAQVESIGSIVGGIANRNYLAGLAGKNFGSAVPSSSGQKPAERYVVVRGRAAQSLDGVRVGLAVISGQGTLHRLLSSARGLGLAASGWLF